jgi:hypothetical protein
MIMAQSLLEFILALLRDGNAKAAFAADPQKTLADAGLGEVCHEDVADAMSYIAEYHPVSFVGDHGYHPGPTNVPPPVTADRPLHNAPLHNVPVHGYGPEPHPSVVHQLEYITTNYSYINNHDTVIDKSVNQHIWNQGLLTQRFDDHSVTAADHSVAAGRLDGDVANGNNNVLGEGNSVGNATHLDNHSVRGAFNGDNIADHAGVAGNGNADNVTDPFRSNVATSGSGVENSPRTAHDTAIRDSFNDSHNRESHHVASVDSGNDNSYHNAIAHFNHESLNHQSFNHESFNNNFPHDSYDRDSAITQTDQHGLINANLSPAIPIPVHHNVLNLLAAHEPPLPG